MVTEIWLKQKYIDEKLSTTQISKICNVCFQTVARWLHKYNISPRSYSKAVHLAMANHCDLTKEATNWINGELLGDGCVRSLSPYSALFVYSSKYPEYINYIAKTLESFGIKQTGKICRRVNKQWGNIVYDYRSCSYVELLSIRKKWYPRGKKIVPKDIKLTSLTVKQWYIGDGSLEGSGNRRKSIILSSEGFTTKDNQWLIKRLKELGFKAKYRASNKIALSSYSTKDFLNYIGKCPVKCYQYKWLGGV